MATVITTTETTAPFSYHVKEIENIQPTSIILNNVINSTSTTTTNTPVITSPHRSMELTSCPCNQLITSQYECADCGDKEVFKDILQISQQHKETTALQSQLQQEKDTLRHDQGVNDIKLTQLTQELEYKLTTIQTTIQGIESLKHDIKILQVKCQEESTEVRDIQQSKEMVKRELEDLSVKLFEEANSMIKIEKEQQELIKETNSQLELDLKQAIDKLEQASSELKLIRNKMEQHDDKEYINHHSTIDEQPSQEEITAATETEHDDHSNVIDTYARAQVEMILMHGLDLGIHMDTLEDDTCLMDFNDFIQQLYKTPLRKLHSLKYMKQLVKEDIEPCLRFGPNPKITAKKIMDAIMIKTCFIEESPLGFITEQDQLRQLRKQEQEAQGATTSLWERFTHSTTSTALDSVYVGCQACGRNTLDKGKRPELLNYRFRISYFDEWACIDRYCRDRLLSVIEFYMFIRHLRAGAYKHRSLHELYQQAIRLRLQMFIAR
jgi:hypothetical protein